MDELPEFPIEDGWIIGELRTPQNEDTGAGSMHSDDTAKALGLRGGPIHGGVHLDLFPPLLHQAFGDRWFTEGTLSVFFRNAVLHGERTQAMVELPLDREADEQVGVTVEREDDLLVCEGTASAGTPETPSRLQAVEMTEAPTRRIFAGLHVGDTSPAVTRTYDAARQAALLRAITDRLPWYEEDNRFGGPVIPPSETMSFIWRPTFYEWIMPGLGGARSIWGALELRYVNGPLLVGREYVIQSRIVGLDEGGKTELGWIDATVDEPNGKRVAETRFLVRAFKASSPLWADTSS